MTGQALIFFLLFVLVIVGAYLGIRRNWAPTRVITVVSVALGILTMVLFSLGQQTNLIHALVVGVLLGSLFTAATIATATFFHNAERQPRPKPPLEIPPGAAEDEG